MATSLPVCPNCNHSDRMYKVNLLYIEASAHINHRPLENQAELNRLLNDVLPSEISAFDKDQVISHLVKTFAPPSTTKKIAKPIHPDWMAIFFSFTALFFFYQITLTQPSLLPIFITLFAVGLLAYVLMRKPAVHKFQRLVQSEHIEAELVEQQISRWMRLYYCSRDQCIIDPVENLIFPVGQLRDFWKQSR